MIVSLKFLSKSFAASVNKTSLAPGSKVVTDYLEKAGLDTYLNQLGFNLVGYGCKKEKMHCL